jgi:hypothetical protein
LSHEENQRAHQERKPRRFAIKLTRNLILYYRKSAQTKRDTEHRHTGNAYQFWSKTKEESWKRPIEAIGVIVVFFYTLFAGYQSCQMRSANRIARDAVTASTRPYIGVAFEGKEPNDTQVFRSSQETNFRQIQIGIAYINFGKLPGNALLRHLVVASPKRLPNGPSLDNVTPIHEMLWPSPIDNHDLVEMRNEFSDAELTKQNECWLLQMAVSARQDQLWSFPH